MKVFVLLPCYNEAASLPELLRQLAVALDSPSGDWQVVAVDDGSTDDTAAVLAEWRPRIPLTVLRHERNCGLGAAMRTGLAHVADVGSPDDAVVTLDADLTHSPAAIPGMLQALAEGYDIIAASRYVAGGGMVGVVWFRRLLSLGAGGLMHLLFPFPGVSDYTSCFRAYRVGVLKQAMADWDGRLVEETGFVCMAEILIKLAALGARVREVPLLLRYDRKLGPSKIRILQTIGRYLVFMRRRHEILRRRHPAPVGEAVER